MNNLNYEGRTVLLPLSSLIPDPLNIEAFNEEDLSKLLENIKDEGFFGEVSVYPVENGMFMIESGHRRCRAAELAGLKEIPVHINDPPSSLEERRRRLVRWNLHNRPTTPLGIAKLAQFLFETYEMQNAKLKEQGLHTEPILERVAADLECSKANVSKYRMLLSLSDELQSLISNGTCSWAPLSAASSLSSDQQHSLYLRILGEMRLSGRVNGSWLEKEIREYRHVFSDNRTVRSYTFDRFDTTLYSQELNEKLQARPGGNKNRKRRKDGMKGIEKSFQLLSMALSNEAFIHDCDHMKAYRILRDMNSAINKAVKRYKETGMIKE